MVFLETGAAEREGEREGGQRGRGGEEKQGGRKKASVGKLGRHEPAYIMLQLVRGACKPIIILNMPVYPSVHVIPYMSVAILPLSLNFWGQSNGQTWALGEY